MELSERIARDIWNNDVIGRDDADAFLRHAVPIIDRHLQSQPREIWNEAIRIVSDLGTYQRTANEVGAASFQNDVLIALRNARDAAQAVAGEAQPRAQKDSE